MKQRSYTILFVTVICFTCALLLSTLTSILEPAQVQAKKIDQSKQMMIAAKILTYDDRFLIDQNHRYVPAIFDKKTQMLVFKKDPEPATRSEILTVFQKKITPKLVNAQGDLISFEQAGINYPTYFEKYKKTGYSQLPFKLIYQINSLKSTQVEGYIIPINGYGLWDAIYGYLAIQNNGDTVIGTTWYQQSETAGLGAEIASEAWQQQFTGKVIFQMNSDQQTDFSRAPLGITVVKGNVKDTLGDSPKAKSSVDGISGASMTGEGVTIAYQKCLKPYRPFFIKLHNKNPEK